MSNLQIPAELKPIRPFLQRADEFRIKDPVISYWCEYHAVKSGMKLEPREPESIVYLSSLLRSVEATKRAWRSREAITNNGVGYLYVKDFANRKFAQVDEEDRRGATSRSTAKRFLGVSQCFEILQLFEGVKQGQYLGIEEKRMYAKQRASEISKAIRDNHTPPRPPHDSRTILPPPDSPRSINSRASRASTTPSDLSFSQIGSPREPRFDSSPIMQSDSPTESSPIQVSLVGDAEELPRHLDSETQTSTRREVNSSRHNTSSKSRTSSETLAPPIHLPEFRLPRRRSSSNLDEHDFSEIMTRMPTAASLVAAEHTLTKPAQIITWSKAVLELVNRTQLADVGSTGPKLAAHDSLMDLANTAVKHITTTASAWSAGNMNRVPFHVAEALYLRGMLRATGVFTEKVAHDPEAAYGDFEAAAKLGYMSGWFRLGQALENTHHIENARELFEHGAKLKEPHCVYRLGKAYLHGELGLPVKLSLAMELLQKAANSATTECSYPPYVFGIILMGEFPRVTLPSAVMAQILFKPESTYPQLPLTEARRYIERSAYLGFGPALYRMGRVYAYAEMGCEHNPQLSVKYYLAASQRGVVDANMGLSKWYLRGSEGLFDKNEELAVAFAKKAADGGSALGMFTIGYYYEMGVGVPANRTEAIKWYAKAAAQGDTEAPERLAKLREKFTEMSGLLNLQQPDMVSAKVASSRMSLQDMFNSLLVHGCTDLSSQIDTDAKSHIAVSGGAFGDIYCGKLRNGTTVAIKAIRHHMLVRETAPKALKRAMREIYTWSKVKHENVQELMGVIVFQGCLGMVSLWMENGNLEEYVRKTPGVNRHKMCIQVAHGVSYLHSVGMVHGDLKARNILVGHDEVLKLSDFDHSILSKCSLAFTETTNVGGGTLRWMAPELFSPTDEEDSAPVANRTVQTDVYALGMTLLEVLTGRLPYSEYQIDGGVIMALHRQKLPKRPKELLSQDGIWALLVTCWNRNPQARPTASSVHWSLSRKPS